VKAEKLLIFWNSHKQLIAMSGVTAKVRDQLNICEFGLINTIAIRSGTAETLLLDFTQPEYRESLYSAGIRDVGRERILTQWRNSHPRVLHFARCSFRYMRSFAVSSWFEISTNIVGVIFGIFLGAFLSKRAFWKESDV
jgi:hypothetical protein